ncbi:MAG TPA: VWA domain-containing protein [Candidatus Limnocylindrales bacterium]|nr:VWA domain-containing protein [Candidatus Limnocylindrales bacterium]
MKSGWSEARGLSPRVAPWLLASLCFWPLAHVHFAFAQEPTPVAGQTIRLSVERVNVGVIVTDAKGKFVEGLRKENFQVFDNGTPQPITEFASVEAPGQILMVVEAGPGVYLLQDAHLIVADSLLGGLSAEDSVAIASYNDAPASVLDFTTDKRAAQSALDAVRFNLGYGDLNLSSSMNSILDWLAPVSGKKTIVLVSTGVDTSPQLAMKSLLARLQTGDVRILAISMSGPLRNGKQGSKRQIQQTQQAFAEADAWLKSFAEATGGRAYFPENGRAFQETYAQMAQLVRHEYSLAFVPPEHDGATHSIEVKVESGTNNAKGKPQEYRVDHRKAYVAPKAAN